MDFEQVLATFKRFRENGVDEFPAAILTAICRSGVVDEDEDDDEIAMIDWCLGETSSQAQAKFLNGLRAFKKAQGHLTESQKAALSATKMTIENFKGSR